MKVRAGKELYLPDTTSAIRKLAAHWWYDLDAVIQEEATEIHHSPLWGKVLGKALSALDWLPLMALLTLPHYYLVRKNPQSYFGDRHCWGFYEALADRGCADEVFKMPPTPALESVRTKVNKTLRQGKMFSFSTPSCFEPVNPAFKDNYWQHHPHTNIVAQLMVHDGAPRPTVMLLHGYDAETYALNRLLFSASELYEAGCNICLMKLPFHRSRSKSYPETTNIFRHGPAYTNEVMAHAVHDCRAMISHLLEQKVASEVAVAGYSLGSFVASLVVSVETRLHSAVLVDPVYNLADTLSEWPVISGLIEKLLKDENLSLQQLRHAYACCNALTFKPAIETSRIMIVAGLYDKIAIPRYARLLGEHWGQCLLIWKRFSHIGLSMPRPFWREVQGHLRSTGFIS